MITLTVILKLVGISDKLDRLMGDVGSNTAYVDTAWFFLNFLEISLKVKYSNKVETQNTSVIIFNQKKNFDRHSNCKIQTLSLRKYLVKRKILVENL